MSNFLTKLTKILNEGSWSRQETVEFPYGEDEELYTAEVTVYISSDSNYGADADGNRGIYREFIDDIKIDSVTNENGEEVEITDDIYDIVSNELDDMDTSMPEPDYDPYDD